MTLSEQLATAITSPATAPAPDLLDVAASYMLDWLGCVYAGLETTPGRKLAAWARAQAAGDHPVPGCDHGLSARDAIFYLGALGHIVEYDDLHRASVLHPGAVIFPAVYVCGREQQATGAELLVAAVAGYEVAIRVGEAVGKTHYRAWHSTSTAGVFGAAAACARLRQLDARHTAQALGSAGTMAAGLWAFLADGAESKHLHTGHAAADGYLAAGLAAAGFTGASQIFEHPQAGFFAATCGPDHDPQLLTRGLDGWLAQPKLPETSIKPYPSCRHTHPAIDAALALRDRVSPEALANIRLTTYRAALDLCDRPQPDSGYAARFSLQYTIAATLLWGRPTLGAFASGSRQDPALLALLPRIAVAHDPEAERRYPQAWTCTLRLSAENGAVFEHYVPHVSGDPERPLARAELLAKFHDLLQTAPGYAQQANALADAVLSLPQRPAIPDLFPSPAHSS